MGRPDDCRSLCYVALKCQHPALAAAPDARRHISADSTLRTRLLPRVSDGKPHARPGMQDTGHREKFVGQLRHPRPTHARPLAAPALLPIPEDKDMVTKRG